jgi:hypothetical protein
MKKKAKNWFNHIKPFSLSMSVQTNKQEYFILANHYTLQSNLIRWKALKNTQNLTYTDKENVN